MDNLLAAFSKNSLLWGLVFLIAMSCIYGLRALVGYRQVDIDGKSDFSYKSKEGMVDPQLSQASYVRAYRRFHAPRAYAHISAVFGLIAMLTLPALGLLNFLFVKLWEFGGQSEAFTPGFLVHALSIFFLIIFFWAFIAYCAARRYHDKAPISFRDELIREMDVEMP